MESSDLQQQHHVLRSPGLMRYQSAPSSYMADLIDREFCQQFFAKPSSPETERIFARFMNSDDNDDFDPPKPIPTTTTATTMPLTSNIDNYSSPTFNYQSASKPPLPAVSQGLSSGAEPQAPYSMGIAPPQFPPMRTGGVAASSGLVRHSSSPAGFFANLNIDTSGYGAMRGMESYGGGGNSNSSSKGVNEQVSFPTASPASRLKRTSSIGPMSPIPEIVDDKANVVQDSSNNEYVPSGFPWDDTDIMSDRVSKRIRDDHDVKPFSGLHLLSENQNNSVEGDGGNRPPALAHHLSLPKTQAEMAAIEKYLQFQDSVPCKIRAKRGCATHPRSIAERVRRTRISERMRKLQDLVPNMEKQTNTADMLDLAVEYIKDLQSQVQTLNESRAKCTCSNKQQ